VPQQTHTSVIVPTIEH